MTTSIGHERTFIRVAGDPDEAATICLPDGDIPDHLNFDLRIKGGRILVDATYLDAPIVLPWNRRSGIWEHQCYDLVNGMPLGLITIGIQRHMPGFATLSIALGHDVRDITVEEHTGEILGPL